MNEGKEHFDSEQGGVNPPVNKPVQEAFGGPITYSETQYVMEGEAVDTEALGRFSPEGRTEYALTHPDEFPIDKRLLEATPSGEYAKISGELVEFYHEQIKSIESGKIPTIADLEARTIAQVMEEKPDIQKADDTPTTEQAIERLKEPGFMEKLNKNKALRQLLAGVLTSTAFATAVPEAKAQGFFNFGQQIAGQLGGYAAQRAIQEGQIELQTRMQLESLKQQCDATIKNIEENMQNQIASQKDAYRVQVENMALQANISLSSIDLSSPDAAEQFRKKYPQANQQQLQMFAQMRQFTLQGNMQMQQMKNGSTNQINQTIRNCDSNMKQISRAASYNRTMRVINDIGNATNVIVR